MRSKNNIRTSTKGNSRQHFYHSNQLAKCKRSQITVFIIIGIVLVGVLLVLFLPNIKLAITGPVPDVELSACLKENVQEALDIVMSQGGSIDPELYYLYEGKPVEYLCYTRDYYSTCIMQKPLLKQSIEAEIEAYVQPRVSACVKDLESRLKSRNFNIEATGTNMVDVQLVPNNVKISLDLQMNIEKDGQTQNYEKFVSDFPSDSYDMVMVASSISNWEAHYGDASPESFMMFYHDLEIQKKKQSDGSTIYIIKNINEDKIMSFASRSLAWPPGYSI